MVDTTIRNVLNFISDELRELDLSSSIPRITTPSPFAFLRDYVAPNKPVIVANATADWPALHDNLWTSDYLLSLAGSQEVTVAFTPNGRADAIVNHPDDHTKQYFALPHQRKMTLSSFLSTLASHQEEEGTLVPYLQQQNSSLTKELPQLLQDVPSHLPWATEAFGGTLPDAVNIWMGDHRSVTSFHKDNYENLYAMVSGSKTFYLYPPVDVHKMKLKQVEVAQWCPVMVNTATNTNDDGDDDGEVVTSKLRLVSDASGRKVLWSSLEVPNALENSSGNGNGNGNGNGYNNDGCFIVTLKAGEVLYLPALWWHAVAHEKSVGGEPVIAVNYWYDMQYDVKYAYFEGINRLAEIAGLSEGHPDVDKEEV